MKNIYLKSLLFIAVCIVALSACKDDEVPMYDGPQRVGFATASNIGYVSNQDPANTSLSVPIFGSKVADAPVTIALTVTKNTAGSRVEILTDLSKVVIPAGKTSVEIQMTTSASYASRVDTIDFEITTSTSDVATQKTTRFFVQGYCPMDQANMDDWNGNYGVVSSGRVYNLGPISMSHVANTDTVIVNISATALQNFYNASYLSAPKPFKICIRSYNPKDYHATIEPQEFCSYTEDNVNYYPVTISSTNIFTGGATLLSPIRNNCTKMITLQFYRPIVYFSGSLPSTAMTLIKLP